MKRILFITAFIITTFSSFSQEELITKYFLIRHAEDQIISENSENPSLNEDGFIRAANWIKIFEKVKFDAIYSLNETNSLQTAKTIATDKDYKIYLYDADDLNNDLFKNNTQGKTILIVGNSITTPKFANAILDTDKYEQISSDIYNNLYIVNVDIIDTKSTVLLKVD